MIYVFAYERVARGSGTIVASLSKVGAQQYTSLLTFTDYCGSKFDKMLACYDAIDAGRDPYHMDVLAKE